MKLEMLNNEFEGKLITFCGLDGCGKTTQIRRLVKWLEDNGYKVYLTKQPTDFVRESEIFRTYMDSPEHDDYDSGTRTAKISIINRHRHLDLWELIV